MPSFGHKTLQDVVHEQILEGKTGAAKRGFFPALSSRLKFPLVTRMSWRGLVGPPHIGAVVRVRDEFEAPAALGDGDHHRHRPGTLAGPIVAEKAIPHLATAAALPLAADVFGTP